MPLAAEQRARLLDGLGRAVVASDADGQVIYWNAAAESMYGWSAEEAHGQDYQNLVVPEFNRDLSDAIRNQVLTDNSWTGGFTLRRRDGSTITAMIASTAVRDDTGALTGYVTVSTDIGQLLLRPLLGQSDQAVVVTGSDGVTRLASPPVERVLGWPDAELVGCSLLDLVHPDHQAGVRRSVKSALADPTQVQRLVYRSRTPSGAWTWVEGVIDNLLADVNVLGLVWTLRKPGVPLPTG